MTYFVLGMLAGWIAEWVFVTFFLKGKQQESTAGADSSASRALKATAKERDELAAKVKELEAQSGNQQADTANSDVSAETETLNSEIDALKQQLADKDEEKSAADARIIELENTLREKIDALDAAAEEEPIVEKAKETPASEPAKIEISEDDLSIIKGIGPKLRDALNEQGISSFEHLVAADIEDVIAKIQEKGIRFSRVNAETWPKQATLAAQGDWSGLDTFKSEMS